jgi:methylated-DNA-[protein]-cysteine S-methyltransferase
LDSEITSADQAFGEQLRSKSVFDFESAEQSLLQKLGERALADDLVDVAVARTDSPVGELMLAATPHGLVRLAYDSLSFDTVLQELSANVSPRVLEVPKRLDAVRYQLDDYFHRRRKNFDLALDWQLTRGFYRRVLEQTARIDYGATSSYREVASAAGNTKAVRAAGSALASNPLAIVVPCHRVLRTGGGLGGYAGGLDRKAYLLKLEAGE